MSPPLKNIALVGVTSVSLNLIFLSARLSSPEIIHRNKHII